MFISCLDPQFVLSAASMNLSSHKKNWEDLGEMDPYWAILSDSERQYGKWDVDKFLRTGEKEIQGLMELTGRLGYPKERKVVLDFGCGIGRLTKALANYFEKCCGVDISEKMILKARELSRLVTNCEFLVNDHEHLGRFPDNRFDMIYSNIVLQHMPSRSIIKSYVSEFVRTLKPDGLLVFQLLSYVPILYRLEPRRRLYDMFRSVGMDKRFLYEKLGLYPIRMNFISEQEVLAFLKEHGAKPIKVLADAVVGSAIKSRTYCVTKW